MRVGAMEEIFQLSEVEVETVRRAAFERGLSFSPERTVYTADELNQYGIVREAYNSSELKQFGVDRRKVATSFDAETARARDSLLVDAPFASPIRKWQIPIDVCEGRVLIAEFPPNTLVEPHVHPANAPDSPGGSLRTVLKGSLVYADKEFGPGEWFYIPNGIPYSFRSAAGEATVVMYKYDFFAVSEGNRFSSPLDLECYKNAAEAA